jgi:hypothetical protein
MKTGLGQTSVLCIVCTQRLRWMRPRSNKLVSTIFMMEDRIWIEKTSSRKYSVGLCMCLKSKEIFEIKLRRFYLNCNPNIRVLVKLL